MTPSFTTRHYTVIAFHLNRAMTESNLFDQPIVVGLITCFAEYLAQDNPRFNHDRFLRACGMVASPKLLKGK